MPASSDTSAPAGAAAGPPTTLSPGQTRRRSFRGDPRELTALRQWVAGLLPDRPARQDVLTVASELGANAINHTASGRGGWFTTEITMLGTVVLVTVADQGGPAEPRLVIDPDGETGRGLLLVAGLSERTGVTGDHQGRRIWAEITWDQPAEGDGRAARPVPAGQARG